ncbi:hypothetical protein NC651_036019 [Populus alba x Populus x berolinensis]|nr:hypothetical protein NC651_036019 [Populus alba x Populus x berolinensis]
MGKAVTKRKNNHQQQPQQSGSTNLSLSLSKPGHPHHHLQSLLPPLNHDLLSQDSCLDNVNLQLHGFEEEKPITSLYFLSTETPIWNSEFSHFISGQDLINFSAFN